MMQLRLIAYFLFALSLLGCASSPPLFTKSASDGPAVNNELSFLNEEGSALFKFRSFGYSENTYERDLKTVTWKKVDEFEAGRFNIVLHAKENEAGILRYFLALPHDNIDRIWSGSKREMLAKVVGEADALAEYVFEKKAVRAKVNFYLAIFDTQVKTPVTDWQYGPLLDPITLNLAQSLPPLGEKYEREPNFHDVRWYSQLLQTLVHEYTHVVNKNKPSSFRTNLADEFIAHTVQRCIGYGVYEFRNSQVNETLLKGSMKFSNDREFITRGKPFATSTTGGQLAATAHAALFSRSEVTNASRERWVEVLPQYCKMIVDAKPGFANTKDALDWIDANIKNANLPFLAKPKY